MNWFTKEDFDFVTLYYGEPDSVGHLYGPDTENRRAMIQQIDRTIGYLLEAIGRHSLTEHLNVIITSDHGMTTMKKKPNITKPPVISDSVWTKTTPNKYDRCDLGFSEGREPRSSTPLSSMHLGE